MRRSLPVLLLLVLAPGAEAAAERCPSGARCRTVEVPLDRSGAVPGTVRLAVAHLKARRPRRPAVVTLTGGPGQGARDAIHGYAFDLGDRVLGERDVIAFDSRGSASSGVIVCPEMQRATVRDTAAAEACARRLGERRRFYTAVEHAEDVEAVRAALRVPKIALYGISYGTKVALTYARLHPERVDRLVLDSVVPAEGASALSLEVLGAMPRVLGAERLAAVTRIVDAVRAAPARGVAVDPRGRRRRAAAGPAGVFDILMTGDFNPVLRQALPSAGRSLAAGDPAPLLRLAEAARRAERTPRDPRELSAGLYAAASCEEIAFPWPPAAPPEERLQKAREALAGVAGLRPFAAEDVPGLDWISLCLRWPVTPGPRPLPPAVPDVPALLLSGEQDLRTPLEDAQRVRATMPRARLLRLPGAGHSVVGGSDCARRAVSRFLRGRRTASRCPRVRTGYERGVPTAPRDLAALKPVAGVPGRAGRTLRGLEITIEDAFLALDVSASGARAGGLRSGYARLIGERLRLHGYESVPGLKVTTRGARFVVSGAAAARGSVTLSRRGRLRGRLGGRRIDVVFR